MRGTWKAWAFLKLGLLTDISYRLSFVFQALNILLSIAAFYFLARLLGEKTLQGHASFPFILIGMAVNGYMTTSLVCFAQGVRGDQLMGTLKAMLATHTSPLALILLSSLYPLVRAAVDAGLYLLGGMLFGLSLGQVNLPAALLFFLVSLLAFSGVGILSATFTLVFKRGDPLLWLFGSLSWLLGGVFYPPEVLPPFLQQTAQLLPITHALEGMRAALLSGAAVAELRPQIAALALFGLVGLPTSLIAFSLGVRRVRVTGTLSHY
jgi:ABC-2 type transport system permease protein